MLPCRFYHRSCWIGQLYRGYSTVLEQTWTPGAVWSQKVPRETIDLPKIYHELQRGFVRENQAKLEQAYSKDIKQIFPDVLLGEGSALSRKALHYLLNKGLAEPDSQKVVAQRREMVRHNECPPSVYCGFLRQLYHHPTVFSMPKVLSALGSLPKPSALFVQADHLEDLVKRALSGPHIELSDNTYMTLFQELEAADIPTTQKEKAAFIHAVSRQRGAHVQERIITLFESWREQFEHASSNTLNILLEVGLRRRLSEVQDFVQTIQKNDARTDRFTLMTYMSYASSPDEIRDLFKAFCSRYHLSSEVVSALVRKFLEFGEVGTALELFEQVTSSSAGSTVCHYNRAEAGKIKQAQLFIDKGHYLCHPTQAPENRFPLVPNAGLFIAIADHYIRTRNFEKLMEHLILMADQGFFPRRYAVYETLSNFRQYGLKGATVRGSWSADDLLRYVHYLCDVALVDPHLMSDAVCSAIAATIIDAGLAPTPNDTYNMLRSLRLR